MTTQDNNEAASASPAALLEDIANRFADVPDEMWQAIEVANVIRDWPFAASPAAPTAERIAEHEAIRARNAAVVALHSGAPVAGSQQVRDALKTIHDTFKRDLDQGYKTRDKEFAVAIAAEALAAAAPAVPVPADQAKLDYDSIGANLRIEQTDPGRWVVCVENWFPDMESAQAACRKWKAAYSSAPPVKVMVDRFLGWKLPKDFYPDAGISFKAPEPPFGWPTGTNLLHAGQAKEMFEYVLAAPSLQQPKEGAAS